MSVVRIAFLGTPVFAEQSLQGLLNDEHFSVVGVVSQPDRPAGRKMQLTPSPVKQLALKHNIPVITPVSVNAPEVLQEILSWSAEAVVVVAFGQIVSQAFLDLFPQRVVNVHASLLPRWRGAAPIQRAIMAGDAETGVSLQVMVRELDAGDVIGERRTLISDDKDALVLHDELMQLGRELLNVEFMDYLRGNLVPTPQKSELVTYAKKISKSEALIDWRWPAKNIFNQVRGLKMGPGSFTLRQGKKLKLHTVEVVPGGGAESVSPGTVLNVDGESFVVSCGAEALRILEVQPESKARISARDYLRGYDLQQGESFATNDQAISESVSGRS